MIKVFTDNSTALQKAMSETLKRFVEDNKASGKYGIKDLYDAVSKSKKAPCYKDKGKEVTDDLKYETFRGWYYGNNPVDLKWIPAICDVLQCDIGFLFGERECKTKDVQGVVDYTGLSESAVEELHSYATMLGFQHIAEFISSLLLDKYSVDRDSKSVESTAHVLADNVSWMKYAFSSPVPSEERDAYEFELYKTGAFGKCQLAFMGFVERFTGFQG